jgi:hypothetical protein
MRELAGGEKDGRHFPRNEAFQGGRQTRRWFLDAAALLMATLFGLAVVVLDATPTFRRARLVPRSALHGVARGAAALTPIPLQRLKFGGS